jgi:hypothetical protein
MHFDEHLVEFGWRDCRRRLLPRLFCGEGFFLFYVDCTGMGNFFDFRGAATRTRNQLFVQLLLKVFKTRKPAFEAVFFLSEDCK